MDDDTLLIHDNYTSIKSLIESLSKMKHNSIPDDVQIRVISALVCLTNTDDNTVLNNSIKKLHMLCANGYINFENLTAAGGIKKLFMLLYTAEGRILQYVIECICSLSCKYGEKLSRVIPRLIEIIKVPGIKIDIAKSAIRTLINLMRNHPPSMDVLMENDAINVCIIIFRHNKACHEIEKLVLNLLTVLCEADDNKACLRSSGGIKDFVELLIHHKDNYENALLNHREGYMQESVIEDIKEEMEVKFKEEMDIEFPNQNCYKNDEYDDHFDIGCDSEPIEALYKSELMVIEAIIELLQVMSLDRDTCADISNAGGLSCILVIISHREFSKDLLEAAMVTLINILESDKVCLQIAPLSPSPDDIIMMMGPLLKRGAFVRPASKILQILSGKDSANNDIMANAGLIQVMVRIVEDAAIRLSDSSHAMLSMDDFDKSKDVESVLISIRCMAYRNPYIAYTLYRENLLDHLVALLKSTWPHVISEALCTLKILCEFDFINAYVGKMDDTIPHLVGIVAENYRLMDVMKFEYVDVAIELLSLLACGTCDNISACAIPHLICLMAHKKTSLTTIKSILYALSNFAAHVQNIRGIVSSLLIVLGMRYDDPDIELCIIEELFLFVKSNNFVMAIIDDAGGIPYLYSILKDERAYLETRLHVSYMLSLKL